MGYTLSSLAQLPVMDEVDLYIFVINGGWAGGKYELITKNFDRIAEEIGSKSVISKSFNEELWTRDICEKYLGKDYKELLDLLPALLLADAHPNNLQELSMRLLVPLNRIDEKFGNGDVFFTSLTRFAKYGDLTFLDLFQKKEGNELPNSHIFELKPNFYGIGINLDEIINRIRNRPNRKS